MGNANPAALDGREEGIREVVEGAGDGDEIGLIEAAKGG